MIEDGDKYVGKDPYLVFGQQSMVGQMNMPSPSGQPSVDWGMSLVWLGDHYLLSADQNTTPGEATQVWRIVAVQDFPLLKAQQMITFGTCMDDQVPVPRVVAVVQYDPDEQWFDGIVSAWAYDFDKQAFVEYPTAKLVCANPRYGLGLDVPPPVTAPRLPAAMALPAETVQAPQAATNPP
ncbi:MAG TPA: hypothetical protein VKT74_07990 [Gammaproteobacteria bacterium]|nr:hypothetical protein [Gammaproteobacteria bacterium]